MERFSLVYIDDNPDIALSRYLDQEFRGADYEIEYREILFRPDEGYKSLLQDSQIQHANIILVDSWLFENKTATDMKFTGEEFKLILKKFFPFIEVVVITQNTIEEDVIKIAKYDKTLGPSSSKYYAATLPSVIDKAVKNIRQYRFLAIQIERNTSWEVVLKEKVIATLNGTCSYDDLTKSDIDKLILAFQEIQRMINVE